MHIFNLVLCVETVPIAIFIGFLITQLYIYIYNYVLEKLI